MWGGSPRSCLPARLPARLVCGVRGVVLTRLTPPCPSPLPACRSAPEVLSGKRCTEKVDLYSFGVVIWEVCTGGWVGGWG